MRVWSVTMNSVQVMELQAEALLRLQRHDEADAVFNGPCAPRFGVDESTKFFGTIGHAYVLIVRAQVDMAAGRFVFPLQANACIRSRSKKCCLV
jgi:hypothetical protein